MRKFTEISAESVGEAERNLLSVAYKNLVGARRSSWRVISSIEQKYTDEARQELAKEYKGKIEGELKGICKEVLVSGFSMCILLLSYSVKLARPLTVLLVATLSF